MAKNMNVLDKFCTELCKIIEKHCKYIVVSGFVAISSGRARATEDIDMIIPKITKNQFIELHKDLSKKFECMQSSDPKIIYDDYLSSNLSVRYIYPEKHIPQMELKFAKDELDHYQIQTRKKIPLTGLDIWFSSLEMNIAFKEELLKSDKDMEDARHLRLVYKDLISEEEIKKIKKLIKKYRLR